jgi:hypothetical protein
MWEWFTKEGELKKKLHGSYLAWNNSENSKTKLART